MRSLISLLLLPLALACRTSKPSTEAGALDTGTTTGSGTVDQDGDGYAADEDCDDNNSIIHPGAPELCDGADNNCDGTVDEGVTTLFYADTDGDGFGDAAVSTEACEAPSGYVPNGNDCNDASAQSYPGAPERCDGEDNDCDSLIDEDVTTVFYADGDGDGHGDPAARVDDCNPGEGYVASADDCDDTDATSFPGGVEVCDEADNNCDGTVDEGVTTTFYQDLDGDQYGVADITTESCDRPTGYAETPGDCDDQQADISPAEAEICNAIDDNCDGTVDEGVTILFYADTDSDGFGDTAAAIAACEAPSGYVANADDCDDTEEDASPAEVEVCDSIDNDCDGDTDEPSATDARSWYVDADSDGYGGSASTIACDPPSGYVDNSDDCDDTEEDASPAEVEVCDSIDNDCDGDTDEPDALDAETFYADSDGDGYGAAGAPALGCTAPSGHVEDQTDCDDADDTVHPGVEDRCNGADDDCDDSIDEDATVGAFLGVLYDGSLYEADVSAGSSAALFSVDDTSVGDYSSNSLTSSLDGGSIYVHDSGSSRILELDFCDESLSELGETGVGNTCGIAFGPDGDLYGIDTTNDTLVRIDTTTGAATEIGDLGFDLQNCGLAYDCATDTLIGMQVDTTDNTGLLFSIDASSGAATEEVALDSGVTWTSAGLEYDPIGATFYASTDAGIYQIDPDSGAATLLMSLPTNNLSFIVEPTCK